MCEYEFKEEDFFVERGIKNEEEDVVFFIPKNNGAFARLLIINNNELFINAKALNKLTSFLKSVYK